MRILDYVLYRIYDRYKKKGYSPIFIGCATLALLTCMTMLSLLGIFITIFNYEYRYEGYMPRLFIIFFHAILTYIYWKRYSSGYHLILAEKYKDEHIKLRNRRGMFIIIYIILLIIIMYGLGSLRNHLGLNK